MKRGDPVQIRAVLAQFLADEATRKQYVGQLRDLASWTHLSDADFLQRVREFEKSRSDVNPVLTYTVGTGTNQHHERVLKWSLETIELSDLYTCGLNSGMKNDLDDVQGNLCAFAKKHAKKYDEFRLGETPCSELKRVIAVRRSTDGRKGTLQLLDGAHRVVALAVQGEASITGYVAELKN